ncbi:hypothetical protein [uncultured Phocaeicola sp.]|uniref:hypothetical protein n=1 Tax=uncultured Phocaeicola sp. TaxID=990718 RepID=UPI00321FC27F
MSRTGASASQIAASYSGNTSRADISFFPDFIGGKNLIVSDKLVIDCSLSMLYYSLYKLLDSNTLMEKRGK